VAKTKIAVTLHSKLLQQLDALVAERRFPNRSQAIETAVAEKLERAQRARLAHECAKLDPNEEKALAEEGMGSDLTTWPEY
jgi:metal-responsive CopG/Arc/MetJ family transcriptional regulator